MGVTLVLLFTEERPWTPREHPGPLARLDRLDSGAKYAEGGHERSGRRSRMIPPLPCLLGFVLGLACDWGWPWPLGPYEYVLPAGVLLAVVVVPAMVTLLRAFSRHDTSPGPERRDHRHRRHWGPSGSRAIRPMSPRGFSRRSWGCSSTMSGFCSRSCRQ